MIAQEKHPVDPLICAVSAEIGSKTGNKRKALQARFYRVGVSRLSSFLFSSFKKSRTSSRISWAGFSSTLLPGTSHPRFLPVIPASFIFYYSAMGDLIAKTFFRGLFARNRALRGKTGEAGREHDKKTLPRASVDARDAEDDATAFRRHPRSDQDPRRELFRLPHVGYCGFLLQDAVSVGVRPKRPRRRGSGDGRESPLPVRGGAGAAAVSIRTRGCASASTMSTRGPCAGASRRCARPRGAARHWRNGPRPGVSPDGGGRDGPSLVQERQMQKPPREAPTGRHQDLPSPDVRGGDHPSGPQGGAAARRRALRSQGEHARARGKRQKGKTTTVTRRARRRRAIEKQRKEILAGIAAF